ncbi:MAG: hypothetical protein ACRDM7_20735, partial [Thermoleophilaceae bacterium]
SGDRAERVVPLSHHNDARLQVTGRPTVNVYPCATVSDVECRSRMIVLSALVDSIESLCVFTRKVIQLEFSGAAEIQALYEVWCGQTVGDRLAAASGLMGQLEAVIPECVLPWSEFVYLCPGRDPRRIEMGLEGESVAGHHSAELAGAHVICQNRTHGTSLLSEVKAKVFQFSSNSV